MDREETQVLMETIKSAYPGFYRGENFTAAINCWLMMFKNDDPDLVAVAIKTYIATDQKGFAPVIGQIKSIMLKLLEQESMTEVEAWTLVKKAIRNSAYNAIEEHGKLPEILQKIVSPEQLRDWALADMSSESVTSSNFMRSYRAKLKQEEELKALPSDVKQMISGFSGKAIEMKGLNHE